MSGAEYLMRNLMRNIVLVSLPATAHGLSMRPMAMAPLGKDVGREGESELRACLPCTFGYRHFQAQGIWIDKGAQLNPMRHWDAGKTCKCVGSWLWRLRWKLDHCGL